MKTNRNWLETTRSRAAKDVDNRHNGVINESLQLTNFIFVPTFSHIFTQVFILEGDSEVTSIQSL